MDSGKDQGQTCCPFHGDKNPSFSINFRKGIYHCFGCGADGNVFSFYARKNRLHIIDDFPAVVAGIAKDFGIGNGNGGTAAKTAAKITARYDYTDEGGTLLYQIERIEPGKGGKEKDFRIRRPNGSGGWIHNKGDVLIVPYHLPEILSSDYVVVVEGEKDVDKLASIGIVATTNPFGAGSWPDHFSMYFAGKNVCLIPDNDEPGRSHMAKVAANLRGIAASIKWIDLPGMPNGGDVSDFIEATTDAAERLAVMIEGAAEYTEPLPETAAEHSSSDDIVLLSAANIEPEPIDWLWAGWIARGKLHMSGGKPSSGKTTVGLSLAAIVSSGGTWPDGTKATAGDVLIWSGEDDPADTLVPRLIAMGANLSRCHILRGVRDGEDIRPFDPEKDMPFLRSAVQRVRFSLMIIDPIILVVKGDSHKNAEVRKSLQPLADMAERLDCAVFGITHFNKGSSGQEPLDRLTGSVAFGAVVRIAFASSKYEEAEEEGARLFARSKSNIGPDGGGFKYRLDVCRLAEHKNIEAVRVAWLEAVSGSARDLIESAEWKPEEPTREDRASEWLRDKLSEGPVRSDVIMSDALEAGFSAITIRRAKKKLNIDSRKEGFSDGGKWLWLMSGGND